MTKTSSEIAVELLHIETACPRYVRKFGIVSLEKVR